MSAADESDFPFLRLSISLLVWLPADAVDDAGLARRAHAGRGRPSSWAAPARRSATRELEERSSRLARALRARGLRAGDHIAILMENNRAFLEVAWAAQRSGLYYTAINSHLRAGRGAVHPRRLRGASRWSRPRRWPTSSPASTCRASRCGSRPVGRARRLRALRRGAGRRARRRRSTTSARAGRCCTRRARRAGPKGVRKPLPGTRLRRSRGRAGADRAGHRPARRSAPGSVYLSPAPLYHSAPLVYSMSMHRLGGDRGGDGALRPAPVPGADRALPGHPRAVRADDVRPDAAAAARTSASATTCRACGWSCTRRRRARSRSSAQMIDWWGPIIHEYYAGTEDIGSTFITAAGVARPSRLGRPARSRSATSSTTTARSCRRASGRRVLRRRPAVRVPQRPGEDRVDHATTRAGARSATSATSTRTATSTSPTARRT